MSSNKRLAEARILAAKKLPYLKSGLMSLVPVERPGLNTCAMDAYGRLYFDANFLEARSLKDCAFIITHEYVHYHQRHAQRQKAVVQNDPARLEVWRRTVEGPTNEIVESSLGWCPEEATTSAKLGLPRNLTVEEAFAIKWKERCEEQQRKEEQEQEREDEAEDCDGDTDEAQDDQDGQKDESAASDDLGAPEGQGDDENADTPQDDGESEEDGQESEQDSQEGEVGDESQDGQGETKGQEAGEDSQGEASGKDPASGGDGTGGTDDGGSGQDGKGEGAANDGQGQGDAGQTTDALSDEANSQLASEIGGSACDGIQRPWELGPPSEEDPGLSESDQKMIEATVAKAIEQHIASRGTGSVPKALAKQASELLHKPVDPCRELAAMTKYAVDTIAGFGEFTFSRPSNRQLPGGCIMPTAIKPIPRITLIIDSSGSMGSNDTAMALDVMGNVLKNLPDPRGLRVLVGGTRVEAAKRVFKPDQIDVLDGGGTDMGVLIRLADQERPAPRVIMCVSDGETPWCAARDVSAKVMVCLTRRPRWCSPPPAWVRTVCLHPDAEGDLV